MQIEELLADGAREKWRVTQQSFEKLEVEAHEKAAALGYEVVVVDFADPGNIYRMGWEERRRSLESYKGRKVLWFHKNVDQGNAGSLCSAREHAQWAGWESEGMADHRFVTSFEDLPNQESPVFASPYSNIWGIFKMTPDEEYINKQMSGAIRQVEGLAAAQSPRVINIVGESGTGKTRTLHWLSTSSHSEFYGTDHNSMQAYGADPNPTEVLAGLRTRGGVLLLDEADLVSPELHGALAQRYRTIVYASHRPLAFADPKAMILLRRPEQSSD